MFKSIFSFDEEKLDAMWRVNVKGTIYCIREALKHMIKRRYGKIINISSTAAIETASAETTLYAITKAAIIALTRRPAFELREYGINVNPIAPSFVLTGYEYQGKEYRGNSTNNREEKKIASLKRVTEPIDITNAAVFLASDESSFITGQVIVIDCERIDYLTHSV